jgi:predicted nuclease of restriction endonuclease-like (RecB) superfamily
MKTTNLRTYRKFLTEIKEKIRLSQYEALKQVNHTLLTLYWDIGKSIVEKQNKLGWGKSVVEKLSNDLILEFPDTQGYSTDNLWRMRKFYIHYQYNTKLAPLVQQISWSHNILILERCKDDLEREYYVQMIRKNAWSKSVLIHQISGKSYEKFLLNNNIEKALPENKKIKGKLIMKDEFCFEFLDLAEAHSEKELELGLMKNIKAFLFELVSDFTLIGNQYRLQVGNEDFYIDILLFHRRLKSLVAIELKTGNFKPEFAGKMNFYLAVLDDTIKLKDENPSIGIIICKSKNKTIVEYALKNNDGPIGVASYQLANTLPTAYKNFLPTPEEIKIKLNGLLFDLD